MRPRNAAKHHKALQSINNEKQQSRETATAPKRQQNRQQPCQAVSRFPLPKEVKEECEQIMLLQEQQSLLNVSEIYPCGLCKENFLTKQDLVEHFLVCCRSVCPLSPALPYLSTKSPPPVQQLSQERSFFHSGLNLRCAVQQSPSIRPGSRTVDIDCVESACISPDSELFWQPMLAVSRVGITSELGSKVPGLFPKQIVDPHGYEKFCAAAPGCRFPTGRAPAASTYTGSARIDRLRLSSRYSHFWSYQGCKSRVLRARREKRLTKIIQDSLAVKRQRQQKRLPQLLNRTIEVNDKDSANDTIAEPALTIKQCSVVLEPLPIDALLSSCSVVLKPIEITEPIIKPCSVVLNRIDESSNQLEQSNVKSPDRTRTSKATKRASLSSDDGPTEELSVKEEDEPKNKSPTRAAAALRRRKLAQLSNSGGFWQVDLHPLPPSQLAAVGLSQFELSSAQVGSMRFFN